MHPTTKAHLLKLMDRLPTLKLVETQARHALALSDDAYCLRVSKGVAAMSGLPAETVDEIRQGIKALMPVLEQAVKARELLLEILLPEASEQWWETYGTKDDEILMRMYIECENSCMHPEEPEDVTFAHVTMRLIEQTMAKRGKVIEPVPNGWALGLKQEVLQ